MCGESWHAMKNSLTHLPSSQGWAHGVQTFLVQVFCCLLYVLGWRDGCYLLLCFLFYSIIYILGLVCYKHTIHVDKLLIKVNNHEEHVGSVAFVTTLATSPS